MVDYNTGTGLIRAACRARKAGTAVIAREIAVAGEVLFQFAHNNGTLPNEKLQALCVYLFGGAVTLDFEKDLLRTTNAAPSTTMSAYPPPWDAAKHQPPKHPQRGPQPMKPLPPQPKAKRAGWVD